MKEFLEYILNQLVTMPDNVVIEEINDDGFLTYEIEVAEEDMGLVIGKQGKTIKSIRSLIRAKAIRDGVRVRVELLDKYRPQEKTPAPENENTDQSTEDMLDELLEEDTADAAQAEEVKETPQEGPEEVETDEV